MAISDVIKEINSAQDFLNSNNPLTQTQSDQFKSDGFLLPATFSADGTGLPSSKVGTYRESQMKRNTITWFVPEFGVVRMYVNPSAITYYYKKLIIKDRTKGGYTLQYWGEDLDNLNISGTTGGAGIEGINVLYEIYRAEQYALDATGLTLAANSASTSLSNVFSEIGGEAGGSAGSVAGSVLGGLLTGDSPNTNLVAQNIPSLAQLAFTVEMYYNGCVYRGFFENMTVNERADNFLLEYQISFVVTQKRGYRLNYFPWARSGNNGPSQYTSPYSFSGNVSSTF
jgi:hypothetical protein